MRRHFTHIPLLPVLGLREAPTKTFVPMRQTNQELLAQIGTELPLNVRKEDTHGCKIVIGRGNPSFCTTRYFCNRYARGWKPRQIGQGRGMEFLQRDRHCRELVVADIGVLRLAPNHVTDSDS